MDSDAHLEDDVLAAFVQGELSPGEARSVEEHLSGCPECDALLVEVARLYGEGDAVSRGRYRILEELGNGAMGIVYAARDERLERKVAIKLLRPGLVGKAEQRLVDEARALAKVSHPNVVQVFDVGRWEGDAPGELGEAPIYVAMEFVDGWTLREWLQVSRPSVDAILDAIEAASRALAAVHDAGLAHRDFKPDNVLMGRDGRVRVTDFGLARSIVETEEGDAFSGTPAYMAPEQLLGRVADAKSDQFALCVTLAEALTGQRPFAGTDMATLREAFRRRDAATVAIPKGAPERLDEVLAQGLAYEPSQRYPDMHAFGVALRQARERKPSAHLRVHLAFLVVLTILHVVFMTWLSIEFARTFDDPAFDDPAYEESYGDGYYDEMSDGELFGELGSLAFACIVVMWAPLGTILAPLTAWGIWRRKRWAAITGVIYAAISLPTILVTPYSLYAIFTLPLRRVRADLDR